MVRGLVADSELRSEAARRAARAQIRNRETYIDRGQVEDDLFADTAQVSSRTWVSGKATAPTQLPSPLSGGCSVPTATTKTCAVRSTSARWTTFGFGR